jgi:hypothetical protein
VVERMIKINKMNKKGIFYSLSVMLFLIFLIIVFNNKAQVLKKDEQFHIERAKIIVMDHFVRDFDRYYAQNIIETATRAALINLTRMSAPFNSNQLIDLMRDGVTGGGNIHINPLLTTSENFNQSLATLSFKLDVNTFSYTLERVWQSWQPDNYAIKLNFHVKYFFSAFDTNWSIADKDVNITVPVYGLWHPTYHEIIGHDWVQNDAGCYINDIMSGLPSCNGMNIMPPPYCGDGIANRAVEDCDGNDLRGETCQSLGFDSGILDCKPDCTYDESDCQ